MGGVSGVNNTSQTYEKPKTENTSSAEKTAQDGVSLFTSSLIEGKGLDGAVNATNQLIQQSVKGALKSAATKFLSMLLGGNDVSQASADAATNTGHIADGTKTLTVLQKKLIEGNLAALEQLLTTGTIDIEQYAQQLTQIAISAGTQGEEATVFSEQLQTKKEENEEIVKQLKDNYGIDISKDEESGEIVMKDKDGNDIVVKSNQGENSNNTRDKEIAALINKYQLNNSEIQALGEQINATVQVQQQVSEKLSEGMTDVVVKGQDLSTVVVNKAGELINEGISEITDAMMQQVGILQGDAVTGYTNAAVDAGAMEAAPVLAAGETVGTLGFGSGHAATIFANGVADGIASGIRATTGSSAVAGIASGLAAGKGLGEIVSSTLTSEAQNLIQSQVNTLTSSLTEGLVTDKEAIDEQSQDLASNNLVKDKDNKA